MRPEAAGVIRAESRLVLRDKAAEIGTPTYAVHPRRHKHVSLEKDGHSSYRAYHRPDPYLSASAHRESNPSTVWTLAADLV